MLSPVKASFFALIICLCSCNSNASKDYRLDNSFIPLNYTIKLKLDQTFAELKKYTGSSEIIIKGNSDKVKNVRIHRSNDLKIVAVSIESTPIEPESISYDTETEIMDIPIPSYLKLNLDEFKLSFVFEGILHEDMQGFYLSEVGNTKEYIATTHFHPTYARRAFPCFDEPSFKAFFKLRLIVPTGYHVLHNQPGKETSLTGNLTKFEFNQTPKMSTYLLAFVISKFDLQKVAVKTDVPMTIWAPNSSIQEANFAAEISYKIIEHLGNQLNTKIDENLQYDQMGLGHVDQIAIPDFVPGAMENWGLVMYRQNELLWNQSDSTAKSREIVGTVITHEFSHNWFGNWVTTSWWNTSWLNEGFARYFQYHGVKGLSVFEEFDLENQFVHEVHQVMESDANLGQQALTSEVETVNEIKSKFGVITYSKGSAIVKMLRNLAGGKFLDYLNSYIVKNKESSVTAESLFECFTEKVEDQNVEVIMKNWVTESGYPVVKLELIKEHEETKELEVKLSQEKFLYKAPSATRDLTKWYIPITYYDSSTIKQILMKPESHLTLKLPSDSFIINPKRRDYYRVNYDPILWQKLIDILTKNHTSIDTMIRVQLVNDVMNLARGSYVPYSTAFALLDYLKNEVEYHPWMAAFDAFGYLEKRFVTTSLWTHITEKLNALMFKFWDNNKAFHIDENSKAIPIYTKVLALEWSCKLGNQDCTKEAFHEFDSVLTGMRTIDPNLQYVVFCSGLRNPTKESDEATNFEFLWTKFQNSQSINEKNIIRRALGCVQNPTLVKDYLNKTLESAIRAQDASYAYLELLEGNPQSIDIALEFLDRNFPQILKKYGSMGGLSKVIISTAERLNSEEQQTKFKTFTEKYKNDLGEDASNANAIIETNREWLTTYEKPLEEFFNGGKGNGNIFNVNWLCFVLICIVARLN